EPYTAVFENRLAALGLGASEIIPIDSLTAQKRMVEAGFGLALLPHSSVDEELRAKTLCALRIRALRVTIPIVLIQRRRAFLSGVDQCKQTPAPPACMTSCNPAPGAANTCPMGFHCTSDGRCGSECTPTGGQCGPGNSCTSDGRCTNGCTGLQCQVVNCAQMN